MSSTSSCTYTLVLDCCINTTITDLSAVSLVPVTATFAFPLTLYYTFLQARVIGARIKTQQSLAQASPPSSSADATKPRQDDPLLAATRSQANFTENVPLALLLAGFVEANGGSRRVLISALSALTVFRVLHVEIGILAKGAKRQYTGIGRPVGFFGTVGVVTGLAGYGAWLVKDVWGF